MKYPTIVTSKILSITLIAIFLGLITASAGFSKKKPDWKPISGNQYNMALFGKIILDGVDFGRGGFTLYSFGPGGENDCRSESEISTEGTYYATIRGNINGQTIHFKVYDYLSGNTYDLKDTIVFGIDDTVEKDFQDGKK